MTKRLGLGERRVVVWTSQISPGMADSERLSEMGTSPPYPSPSSPSSPADASSSSYSDADLGIIVGPLLIGVILCSYIIYIFARRRRQLQEMYIDPESDTSSLNSSISASSRELTHEDNQRLIPHHTRRWKKTKLVLLLGGGWDRK